MIALNSLPLADVLQPGVDDASMALALAMLISFDRRTTGQLTLNYKVSDGSAKKKIETRRDTKRHHSSMLHVKAINKKLVKLLIKYAATLPIPFPIFKSPLSHPIQMQIGQAIGKSGTVLNISMPPPRI